MSRCFECVIVLLAVVFCFTQRGYFSRVSQPLDRAVAMCCAVLSFSKLGSLSLSSGWICWCWDSGI